jgi:hypothetical protein
MDYEALKEQWSEIEDRDGVRLSWNTFPSSRMVWHPLKDGLIDGMLTSGAGSIAACRYGISVLNTFNLLIKCSPHRCTIHALEGEDGYPAASV